MDMLKTDRTYKTRVNAVAALQRALPIGVSLNSLRYVIAASTDGRFAPVVIGTTDREGNSNMHFPHRGVTLVQ